MKAEIIRSLERYRIAQMAHPSDRKELEESTIISLIFNDNLLEGQNYPIPNIKRAFTCDLQTVEPYLVPDFKRIRSYRALIEWMQQEARRGIKSLNLENLKYIHQAILSENREEGDSFRTNSPVHRDYAQAICGHEQVPNLLKKFFEEIASEFEEATDLVAYCAQKHHQLMYIYPFKLNPGSTARLFTNLMFLSQGYPPLILSGLQRSEYYEALCQSDATALTELFYEAFQKNM